MTDVFISYKQADRDYAHSLAKILARRGFTVWWDIELLPGQKFADEINAVIGQARSVVVLWTSDSIKSTWVLAEASLALDRGILVPVWLRKTALPAPFNTVQTLDLTSWDGSPADPKLNELVAGIRRLVGNPPSGGDQKTEKEVEEELTRPADEVAFWTSISSVQPQSIQEYRLYLERFGEDGAFTKLAKVRIGELERRQKTDRRPGFGTVITLVGIVVGIVVGVFQIREMLDPSDQREKTGRQKSNNSTQENQSTLKRLSDANSTPVARRDEVRTDHLTPVTGNLFSPDFNGADYDPDNDAFAIHSVQGSAANVGKAVTLESGATIVVSKNGDFTYDPRPGFKFLTKPGSGSADRLTYSLIDERGAKSPEVLSMFMVKKKEP